MERIQPGCPTLVDQQSGSNERINITGSPELGPTTYSRLLSSPFPLIISAQAAEAIPAYLNPARNMALLLTAAAVVLVVVTAFTLHSGICLLQNYLAARKIGVPVRIIPVDHMNPLWFLVSQKVVSLLKRLPFGLADNNMTKYNYLGFELSDRWKSHEEMGDAFILCSPSRNWLYLGDPDVITTMFRRIKDFPHDSSLTAMLDVFGPNISTVRLTHRTQTMLNSSCRPIS